MIINGGDCSIVIKTAYREIDIPYAEETIRESVSLLVEEASIEGNGIRRAIRLLSGITGCIVTPLTIGTAPLLLYLAFGSAGLPVFVSETRNVYQYGLDLVPMETGCNFDLVQDRGGERRLFERCHVKGFTLRINRMENIYLKLDLCGESAPAVYPYSEKPKTETGERFNGDFVTYRINGVEYKNIYGFTLSARKEGGTKTEVWIKRILRQGPDLPENIEEMTITARLLSDNYELRYFGMFRLTVKRLVLISDETIVDCADGVIGPLRYYVAGSINAAVYADLWSESTGEIIS